MNEYCNIEIQKLASSAASGRYLLGYNGKFFEANSYVVELINCLQEHADEDVAISKYIEKRQGKYTKEQVKGFIEKYFLTLTMRHPSWIFLFFGGRIVTFAPV